MSRMDVRKVMLSTVAVIAVVALLASDGRITGQEKKTERKAAAERKERAEPRGRLPAYFADLVNAQQREEIYAIQAKYNTEIEKIRNQLAALESERDKAVDAVLTPEQLAEVNKKREEAAKKRSTGRSAKQQESKSQD